MSQTTAELIGDATAQIAAARPHGPDFLALAEGNIAECHAKVAEAQSDLIRAQWSAVAGVWEAARESYSADAASAS